MMDACCGMFHGIRDGDGMGFLSEGTNPFVGVIYKTVAKKTMT